MKLRYLCLAIVLCGLALIIRPAGGAAAVRSVTNLVSKDHTLTIQKDGSLWAWGSNGYGELGLGDTIDRLAPVRVGRDNNWLAVAAGFGYSLGLKADGTLWAWGANETGRLGLGDTTNRLSPTQVPRFNAPRTAVISLN